MLTKTLNGLGWVSIFSVSQLVANLTLTMVLARLLSPEEFGSYAFALIILSLLQVFALLGTNAAIVQIEGADDHFFATGFFLVLTASSLVALLSISGISMWLAMFPTTDAAATKTLSSLRILFLSLPFFAVAEFLQALYNRALTFRTPAAINFVSFILGFALVSLVLTSLGFGVYSLIFGFVSQQVLRVILLFSRLDKRPSLSFAREDAKRILRYGLGFSIAKFGNAVALQVDNFVVANALGNAALGLYSRAYQIIMSPVSLITMIVDRVLFPVMSRRQNDVPTLQKAFLMLNSAIFALLIPMSLALLEYRHEFVLILLGENWSAASTPFGLLGLALSFRSGYRLSDIVARARGYVYKRALVQWIYAVSVGIAALVGSRWGLGGVALGVSGAVAVNWMLMTSLTMQALEISLTRLLSSMLPALFTLTVSYLAFSGLNTIFDRTLPLLPPEASGGTIVVVATILLAALAARPALGAQREWLQIYRRARHGR